MGDVQVNAVAVKAISDIILFQNLMQDIVESWLKVGSYFLQTVQCRQFI